MSDQEYGFITSNCSRKQFTDGVFTIKAKKFRKAVGAEVYVIFGNRYKFKQFINDHC